MVCPKCGSNNITSHVTQENSVETKTKGFGCIKACLGFCVLGPIGWLCGLCGMGKGKTTINSKTKVIHLCQNCGHTF